MLQAIRDRASGWIAYFIVFLISIPFALWGIHEYFGGGDPLIAAEVNGTEIPVRTFTSTYQDQRRYLQSLMGGRLPPGYDESTLKQTVIKGLVRNELLRQEIDNAHYHVSDRVLFDQIQSFPAFQVDGKFDPQHYERLLQSQRRSAAEFEQDLRQDIRQSQFEDGVRNTGFLPPRYQQDFQRLKNQTRDVVYFILKGDLEAAKRTVTEQEIDQYYRDHTERFQTPERVKLAYIRLNQSDLAETIEVDEAALQGFYEEQADRYAKPEERRARHILVKPAQDKQARLDAAKREAEQLISRLKAGEDFAALAKEHSDDTLSAAVGGDLGYLARGDMAAEFEQALFNLEPQAISDAVKTPQGYEIVQLMEVKPAEQKPFDEVRAQVEQEFKQRAAETRFVDLAERLQTLSYEQPDSLQSAAEATGLTLETSEWMSRGGGRGIGTDAKVREAAFSADVLQERRNSDLLELASGDALVLRIAEHQSAAPKALDDVKNEISDLIARAKARDKTVERGREAVAALQNGESSEVVAERFGTHLESPGFVARMDQNVPRAIVQKVFTMRKPSGHTPTISSLELPGGEFAVVVLESVREGEGEGPDKGSATQAQVDYGARELEATNRYLEQNADIKIFTENL